MKAKPTHQNQEWFFPVISVCLLILTAIAVTGTLMYLQAVMIPFVLSLFVYLMISPAVDYLQLRLKIPKWASIAVTLVIALLFFTLIIILISGSLREFFESTAFYQARLIEMIERIQNLFAQGGLAFDLRAIQKELKAIQVFGFVRSFTGEFMGILGNFFLILVFVFFLLVGQAASHKTPALLTDIKGSISKYIWTKFLLSFATGLLVGVFLKLVGLDLAFMFGVLAFLLNFIPNIGSVIATFLPLPVALLQFGPGVTLLLILLIPGGVQFFIGNILEPKLMGESLGLHPVTILFFLIFWGIVWGLPGMFLAVPITAILKYILEKIPQTRRLARLLAGELVSS